MASVTEEKKPLDQLVELAVFAPIGFALEARRLLPTFVDRGRRQVEMAKFVGRFAVQHGQSQAGKRLTRAQAQAESILGELGLSSAIGSTSRSGSTSRVSEARPEARATKPGPTSVVAPLRSSAAAAELAIADYDSLAASQVIPRLAGLEPAELAAVRVYELGHRGRKTILGKIAQLSDE